MLFWNWIHSSKNRWAIGQVYIAYNFKERWSIGKITFWNYLDLRWAQTALNFYNIKKTQWIQRRDWKPGRSWLIFKTLCPLHWVIFVPRRISNKIKQLWIERQYSDRFLWIVIKVERLSKILHRHFWKRELYWGNQLVVWNFKMGRNKGGCQSCFNNKY